MATASYTVIWGRTPGELIHENTYADEKMAWSVYRNLSFTDYAALLCEGEVIAHNGERGPVIGGDDEQIHTKRSKDNGHHCAGR